MKKTFDNLEYKFKIFDTPGQERFKSFSNSTIQIADGYFIVFSVDNKRSFIEAIDWIEYIDDHVNLEEKALYLVGNKIDIERQVTKEEVEVEIISKRKNIKYFETSEDSKTGINEAFEEMFKDVYEMNKINKKKERNFNFELDKKSNNFFDEIFKMNNKKKINYHYESDNQDNKKKSNYSPFSNYILDKFNSY